MYTCPNRVMETQFNCLLWKFKYLSKLLNGNCLDINREMCNYMNVFSFLPRVNVYIKRERVGEWDDGTREW